VVALTWRIVLLARIARTPLLDALQSDAATYWAWSGLLRARGWMGVNPFFLAPLYPYVLAGMRSLLGDSVMSVLVVQAVVGAVAAPLLADAARRLTTRGLGLMVGVVAAGYSMSALYGILVLSECLLFALGCALVWLLVAWPWERRVRMGAILAGILIGLMACGRATSLVLTVPVAMVVFGSVSLGRAARAQLIAVG